MRITSLKFDEENVNAVIRINFFKSKTIQIKTIELALMFNDPNNWEEIESLSKKEIIDELANVLNSPEMRSKQGDTVLAELILKIAGEHHNPFENQTIRMMLDNRKSIIKKSDENFNVDEITTTAVRMILRSLYIINNMNPSNTHNSEVTKNIIVNEIPKSINISQNDLDYAYNMDHSEFMESYLYLSKSDKELFKNIIKILKANLIGDHEQCYCDALLTFTYH